jgi:hypothetical protein
MLGASRRSLCAAARRRSAASVVPGDAATAPHRPVSVEPVALRLIGLDFYLGRRCVEASEF